MAAVGVILEGDQRSNRNRLGVLRSVKPESELSRRVVADADDGLAKTRRRLIERRCKGCGPVANNESHASPLYADTTDRTGFRTIGSDPPPPPPPEPVETLRTSKGPIDGRRTTTAEEVVLRSG